MTTTSVKAVRVASVEEIRAQFPALARTHGGVPVAYFDGPGGTQVPTPVVDAVSDYLLHHNANTYWAYPTSAETDALLLQARAATADFLNATPEEIAFGNNMTTLTFHLARGLAGGWKNGDEVVITDLDHHANIAPWRRIEREKGITIRTVGVKLPDGELDWASLEKAVGPKTKLVAVGAASNAVATVNDVKRIAQRARGVGALVFVDAVHYAPHSLVDVRAMDCDFLVCSPYKYYGPHTGVLYARRDLIDALDVPRLAPAAEHGSERLETGTLNHEGIVGSGAAVTFLASLADGAIRRKRLESVFSALHVRGQALVESMWNGLSAIPGVTMHGPPPSRPRTPTVAFTLKGRPAIDVARHLADRGVFVSHGDFYASTIVKLLGHAEDGLVRAGAACYTTADEVDRLIKGVAELASR